MSKHLTDTQDKESCLIGLINQMYYGFKTVSVKEIIELPELKSLPNFPQFFSGILDYRGTTIPVLDAKLSLGFSSERYSSSDILVVIEEKEEMFGIILPSLFDIQDLPIIKKRHFSQSIVGSLTNLPIIKEVSKYNESLVFLFDTEGLLAEINALFSTQDKNLQKEITPTSKISETTHKFESTSFISKVPVDQHQLFAERAKKVSEEFSSSDSATETISLTILRIFEKRFAIESDKIREFCYISDYAPIPSSQHLLGFMNLRGSILPLADIWFLLQRERLKIKPLCKVVILEFADSILGFVVDEAEQVISVEISAFSDLLLDIESEEEPFIKKTVKIGDKIIGVLDTEKLLQTII